MYVWEKAEKLHLNQKVAYTGTVWYGNIISFDRRFRETEVLVEWSDYSMQTGWGAGDSKRILFLLSQLKWLEDTQSWEVLK
jgi:hypothetical protein